MEFDLEATRRALEVYVLLDLHRCKEVLDTAGSAALIKLGARNSGYFAGEGFALDEEFPQAVARLQEQGKILIDQAGNLHLGGCVSMK